MRGVPCLSPWWVVESARRMIQAIDADTQQCRMSGKCGSEQTVSEPGCFNAGSSSRQGIHMYIGGGILGTLLLIALIIYVVRRI